MDNITHTLTGLAMSRAGLNRFYTHATPLLLVAANAPDIDIVVLSRGGFQYFRYHRAITHTLIAAPVLALGIALLFCALDRSLRNLAVSFGIALAGVASHLLLDWTNAYGVRFLFPFDSHWYGLDLTNIFDVWIWAVLILAAVGPPLARLVSSEVGGRSGSGRGLAIFALVFLALYNGGRGVMHQRAVTTLESRVYDGASPLRTGAFPTVANPFSWDGVVETRSTVRHYHFSLLDSFDPDSAQLFQKPDSSPAIDAAARTPEFRAFLAFSKYPLWTVVPAPEPENAVRVQVRDMRFGFTVETVVDARNHAADATFRYR
jgi:inner membrane protein